MVIAEVGWIRGPLDLRTDVCVVGSGIGGAVVAHGLAEAGLDVIVLEEGGDPPPADSELEARRHRLRDRGLQHSADRGVAVVQGRLLGGSLELGRAAAWRVGEDDLETWAASTGLAELSPASMAASYAAAGPPPDPGRRPTTCPTSTALGAAARRLGWTTRTVPAPSGCVACGRCLGGCPGGKRTSVRDRWVRSASERGARFVLGCRAEHLRCIDGTVEGVACRAFEDGAVRHRVRVRASAVVMAAGALHTPSLMLISRVPDPHRTTGDRLKVQPTSAVVGRFEADLAGTGGDPLAVTEFQHESPAGFVIAPSPLPLTTIAAGLPAWGGELDRLFERLGAVASLAVTVRDQRHGWVVPLPDGRPVIRYELAPQDRRTLERGLYSAARALLEAGAREVFTTHGVPTVIRGEADLDQLQRRHYRACDLAVTSTGPLGTCAMGADPHNSVTDAAGRVHGVRGLYVADASLIPDAPGLPLGATVAALAPRVVAGVVADLGSAGAS